MVYVGLGLVDGKWLLIFCVVFSLLLLLTAQFFLLRNFHLTD